MPKIVKWDIDTARKELYQRLNQSRDSRANHQTRWEANERMLFNTKGSGSSGSSNLSYSFDSDISAVNGVDQGDADIGVNYIMKNLRFIHAQLSANPPSVIPQPTSNDSDDRRRADAADRLVRFGMRRHKMAEIVDGASWNMLIYGTGFVKTMWDPDAGDILDVSEDGELTMEGDFHISIPDPWNVYPDPEARTWDDVRYVFERIYMPFEEAKFRYPEKEELLEQYRITEQDKEANASRGGSSAIPKTRYDSVELYQYWEKGLPQNGFMGRFCICTRNGELVTEVEANPEIYSPPKVSNTDPKRSRAVLPFHIFTDLDVPGQYWGKAIMEYETSLQDNLNRLDSVVLESLQAHGIPRLVLPEGAEVQDDSITNSPWDIVKITGNQPPHFMETMPLPPGLSQLRELLKMGIDDMAGVNEAMFGQQSREQSGFSMQYASNQGNMIRRRLLNKYELFVESIYRRYLEIVQKHWDTPRTIHVLGKEKAFETTDLKGADISGGYDLVVRYGASLSLDPTTRREEIITLMPIFEKAGVETREILSMLKLNELSGMYDRLDLARDRQREVFEEMVARGIYIPPQELEDHKNMLSFAYYYRMTTEFKYLDDDSKVLVEQHIREREQMAATQQATASGALGGLAPGPAPAGAEGLPPEALAQALPLGPTGG